MKTKLLKIGNNRGILVDKNTDNIIIMIGGFERTATTEKKFKKLADNVNISSFRFDYSGIGLSDGDFSNITISSMTVELKNVLNELSKDYKNFIVFAHSLSACVIHNFDFEKNILISPALNQKELLRYYFVLSDPKLKDVKGKIDWSNYRNYLNEDDFLKNCELKNKMTKNNYIFPSYFLENKNIDYSKLIKRQDNILHIHGDKDDKVPIESLNIKFNNSIIVKNGDHDLERPDMMIQWEQKAIEFIEN